MIIKRHRCTRFEADCKGKGISTLNDDKVEISLI